MGSCASTRVESAQDVLGHDAERNPGLSRRHRKTSRGKTEAKTVGDGEVNSCLGRRGTSDTAASAAGVGATEEFATKSSREALGASRKNGQHLDSILNSCFYVLPIELLRSEVLTFLSAPCLGQAGMTCVTWRDAAVDESLWKSLCLGQWVGKHLALLDGLPRQEEPCSSQGGKDETSDSRVPDTDEQKRRELMERVGRLHGGLEDLVAAMTIKSMKRRLEELGANPRRLASCLEKGECVSLVMGSMLLSREGLLREGGQLPPWVSSMRGWRWSYYFAKVDSRRCWLTMDDLVRSPWTMSFPADRPTPTSPLLIPSVTCEFHRDFSYTDEGFHQNGLDWHFEDSHRCVKVSNYPALEAERDGSWGWRLVNSHVVFEQQRRLPSQGGG